MSRGNRDQQSTVDERCDGCDRGIDQVYLDAGTSFDVWLNDAARSDQPAPSHGQYHFCGTCVFEVLGLVDEHFGGRLRDADELRVLRRADRQYPGAVHLPATRDGHDDRPLCLFVVSPDRPAVL